LATLLVLPVAWNLGSFGHAVEPFLRKISALARVFRPRCPTLDRYAKSCVRRGLYLLGATGFEPATSRSRTGGDPDASLVNKEVAASQPSACTTACTNKPKNEHEAKLEALAAQLASLPAEDRAKLGAMLSQGGKEAPKA
jgi:hypothetical protein